MIIPPELRVSNTALPPCKSRADLESQILTVLERSQIGVMPMRHLTRRFSITASKLSLSITNVLNDMSAAGRLCLMYYDSIGRTFVFSAKEWTELNEDKEHDWYLYEEKILRPLK